MLTRVTVEAVLRGQLQQPRRQLPLRAGDQRASIDDRVVRRSSRRRSPFVVRRSRSRCSRSARARSCLSIQACSRSANAAASRFDPPRGTVTRTAPPRSRGSDSDALADDGRRRQGPGLGLGPGLGAGDWALGLGAGAGRLGMLRSGSRFSGSCSISVRRRRRSRVCGGCRRAPLPSRAPSRTASGSGAGRAAARAARRSASRRAAAL